MARDRACKLQILSVKHPGLLQAVETMFKNYASSPEVRRMVEQKYHEDVGETAIDTYRNNHWEVRMDMILKRVTAMKAVSQLVGEDGLTAGVNALLWECLQEMTPTQLMAFKRVLNDSAKVALMKKQFALYAQEHRQKMKERSEQADKGNVEVVEDFEAARRMVEQAKEIFGIGTTAIAPPVRKLLGPAEETTSPAKGAPVS